MSYCDHPSIKMREKVSSLCVPLFERFNMTGFCYDMSFSGGELSVLTDNINNFESLYACEYTPICSDASGRTIESGVYTLNLLSKNSADEAFYTEKFESLYETSQIIHIVDRGNLFDEMVTFSFDMHKDKFDYFVLNDLPQLKSFVRYFKESMKNEIAFIQKKEHRLYFPDLLAGNMLHACLDKREDQKILCLIREDGQEVIIPPQQAACLTLLATGQSVKQIASALFLSTRTVEHYLAAVRTKLSCNSLLTLMSKYGDQL